MPRKMSKTVALLAISIKIAIAQVQPNLTICNWAGLRSAIIRDTIYLDGGNRWQQTALNAEGVPLVESSNENDGLMFSLNLSYPFDTTVFNETTSLLQPISKTGGTAANNIAPNYIDGAMLANDQKFYLYGGLLRSTDAFNTEPDAQALLEYEAYPSAPDQTLWSRGFVQSTLSDGVTRYVSNGAAVSVPSEDRGFYFSGLRGPDWGPVTESTDDFFLANTLIDVDMSTTPNEQWSNNTLPDDIPPRAGAELVWIPVGGQGALLVVGGMTAVEYRQPTPLNSSQSSEAEEQAPGFMSTLGLYDIATETWYTQNTTGDGPGQLTSFCSVVAQANDSSSINVYFYGGYDGLNYTSLPSDDVWILSIPSFTWIRAYTGVRERGRRGHTCEKIYPDQMLVMGGVNVDVTQCFDDGPIRVFNLNTLEFQDRYDPTEWSEYVVPDVVTAVIGGNGGGGSTRTTDFSDEALSSFFEQPYTRTINTYYPYSVASGSPGATPIPSATPNNSGGGLANWVAPVLGVVLGLIVLSIIAVLIILYLRRKGKRRNSSVGSNFGGSSNTYNNPILKWVNGMSDPPSSGKTDPSVTSEVESDTRVSSPPAGGASEVAGTERYEMGDLENTNHIAELEAPLNSPRAIDFAGGPGSSSDKASQPSGYGSGNGSHTPIHGLGLLASPTSAVSPQSPLSTPTHLHSHTGSNDSNNIDAATRAPSPYVLPHRPEDVGAAAPPRSLTTSPSPPSSVAVSPDLKHTANISNASTGNGEGGNASGLERRPTHQRNLSSLSSHIYQLPSPDVPFSPDEEHRRSRILSGLSPGQNYGGRSAAWDSTAASAPAGHGSDGEDQLVSPETPHSNVPQAGLVGPAGERKKTAEKKSSFGEMLDEGRGR